MHAFLVKSRLKHGIESHSLIAAAAAAAAAAEQVASCFCTNQCHVHNKKQPDVQVFLGAAYLIWVEELVYRRNCAWKVRIRECQLGHHRLLKQRLQCLVAFQTPLACSYCFDAA